MATRPRIFRPAGVRPKPKQERQVEHDQRRGSARDRGYDSTWERARRAHLDVHPLCEYCAAGAWGDPPRTTLATLVDHIVPHKGDRAIFWFRPWWASSCAPCHNGPKQAAEAKGWQALAPLLRLLGRPSVRRD